MNQGAGWSDRKVRVTHVLKSGALQDLIDSDCLLEVSAVLGDSLGETTWKNLYYVRICGVKGGKRWRTSDACGDPR